MPTAAIPFRVGEIYSREDVANAVSFPVEKRDGGDYTTGYFEHDGAFFIFANIGAPGRTGHDYPNRWDGRELIWFAKNGTHIRQPRIQAMTGGKRQVYVFWRPSDRVPFTFAGAPRAVEVDDVSPVRVLWSFSADVAAALVDDEQADGASPSFKRGPAPTPGERNAIIEDRETSTYLMRLVGPLSILRPGTPPGHEIIKIGMSSVPHRRVAELNNGYPPGASARWTLLTTRAYADGQRAFAAEGSLLEWLRRRRCWIGGEYAVVNFEQLAEIEALLLRRGDTLESE